MTINLATLAGVAVVLSSTLFAFAKREAPKDVPPVTHGGVVYRAPNDVDNQGYVLAYDVTTGQQLWARQLYIVIKDPGLESDIQDVFIKSMKIEEDDQLLITNEKDSQYRLDLRSLNVKVISGTSVVRPDILHNADIEYRAPDHLDQQGCVLGFDARTGKQICARQLYVVLKIPSVPADQQDVPITSMKREGETLLVTNQMRYQYRLDLGSLNVDVVIGYTAVRSGILHR